MIHANKLTIILSQIDDYYSFKEHFPQVKNLNIIFMNEDISDDFYTFLSNLSNSFRGIINLEFTNLDGSYMISNLFYFVLSADVADGFPQLKNVTYNFVNDKHILPNEFRDYFNQYEYYDYNS